MCQVGVFNTRSSANTLQMPVCMIKDPANAEPFRAFSFDRYLRRFEVSLHNPSCKLHKAMRTGTLPYFNALADTRRCLPCTVYYMCIVKVCQ